VYAQCTAVQRQLPLRKPRRHRRICAQVLHLHQDVLFHRRGQQRRIGQVAVVLADDLARRRGVGLQRRPNRDPFSPVAEIQSELQRLVRRRDVAPQRQDEERGD
jgi:hypothetical protein